MDKGFVIWLTGLSGSGKTTIANILANKLRYNTIILDGDEIRKYVNCDLGFSLGDRVEHAVRVAGMAKIFAKRGIVVIVAMITPIDAIRFVVKEKVEPIELIEIFLDCPLEICKQRDPKGLYNKAEKGIILNFTGISSPWEPPCNPNLIVDTNKNKKYLSSYIIESYLRDNGMIK